MAKRAVVNVTLPLASRKALCMAAGWELNDFSETLQRMARDSAECGADGSQIQSTLFAVSERIRAIGAAMMALGAEVDPSVDEVAGSLLFAEETLRWPATGRARAS